MAVGKAISNKTALYAEGGKNAPEIAMPDIGQPTAVSKAIDPWNPTFHEAQQIATQENGLPSVPDLVPQEVVAEMDSDDQPDQESIQAEPQVEQQVEESSSQEKSKPTGQSNFKLVREAKEKAERERDAILAQMLEMQKMMIAKEQPKQQQPVYEEPETEEQDFNIDDDGLVEGKYVKKVVNEIKALKSQLKEFKSQATQTTVESKIKNNYPDFEKVVSKENVEMLNQQFPEIAQSLRDTQDLYSKASSAYAIIKKFGIYQEPKPDLYQNDRAQAVINAQKPRPLASVNPQQGDSPLSKANAFANGMTKDLQKQLLAEMMAAKKNM